MNQPPPFPSVALIGRPADAGVAESMAALANHLVSRGRRVVAEADAANAHLAIAVGGDGTMLHAARIVAQRPVPLLGINRGRLGFLADVSPDDMLACVDEILNGEYTEERRTLLEAHLSDGSTMPALNDVVLQKGEAGKLLDFETWIDGRYVNTHSGDGLIVASATGSTAYALSCGGPIVHPELNVLVLAPICPHTLSDRPVIVPGDSRVEIRLAGRAESRGQVVCDGVQLGELSSGQRLRVQPSPNKVTLLHPRDYDYYRLLRSKLHWGRGPQNGPALER